MTAAVGRSQERGAALDGIEEVIRIRISKIDKLGWAPWVGMLGQPHTGAWAFPIANRKVSDELVVALEWKLTAWVPVRIVDSAGGVILPPTQPEPDDEMWVPGTASVTGASVASQSETVIGCWALLRPISREIFLRGDAYFSGIQTRPRPRGPRTD